jgi:hypothetical protein
MPLLSTPSTRYRLCLTPGRPSRPVTLALPVSPRCGIDSVLPDETDVATLRALHHDRFEVAYRLDAIGTRERAAGD